MQAIVRDIQIGPCRLVLGDCRDVLPLVGIVDAVVTDPPYGIQKHAAFVRGSARRVDDSSGEFNDCHSWAWLEQCEWLKPGGNVAVFARREDCLPMPIREWHRYYILKTAAPPSPRSVFVSMVEQCLIGSKPGGPRGWYGTGWEPNWWSGLTPKRLNDGNQTGHPAEKPLEPIVQLVRCLADFSDVVCDPFMGSGTTGVACIRTGRQFIGIERNPEYYEIAVCRIRREWQDKCSELKFDDPPQQTSFSFG